MAKAVILLFFSLSFSISALISSPISSEEITTLIFRASSAINDAEELSDGSIELNSSDLELGRNGEDYQTVGIRFCKVNIPPKAEITNAYIQFQADEKSSDPSSLTIHAQAVDSAPAFLDIDANITDRELTNTSIDWNPDPWESVGEANEPQQTPNLSKLIQELVFRPGWDTGNCLAFIISGTGTRTAKSYENAGASAYYLFVEFEGEYEIVKPTPLPTEEHVKFAVIGDFGIDSSSEALVANLVNKWEPDFVVTTGDNNYPDGKAETIDENIGKYYSKYIGNYQGVYGLGAEDNRFWPSLGNHDWRAIECNEGICSGSYLDYFTLPGNERYYEVDLGPIHLFSLDSFGREPDGFDSESIQALWLKEALSKSKSCFKIVYVHYPPYSSAYHGSTAKTQWPFEAWGADVVISGHDHSYERIDSDGFPYIINGSGGAHLRGFDNIGNLPPKINSVSRYNNDHGAMLVIANKSGITYQFYNTNEDLIDELSVEKYCIDLDPEKQNKLQSYISSNLLIIVSVGILISLTVVVILFRKSKRNSSHD